MIGRRSQLAGLFQDGVILGSSRPEKSTDYSLVEVFRHDYNHVRPHSSIGFKTLVEFMKSIDNPNQPKVP